MESRIKRIAFVNAQLADPGLPEAFVPALVSNRRESPLPFFRASVLTLKLHIVPEAYYASVAPNQGEWRCFQKPVQP